MVVEELGTRKGLPETSLGLLENEGHKEAFWLNDHLLSDKLDECDILTYL